jgi:glycosyltransferase involved in cell wall biosynthesis
VKILLSAFQCCPGKGSEPGNGWHWANALADFGHDVTVLTLSDQREAILAAGPRAEFRFIDLPSSPLLRFSSRLEVYDVYQRWQRAALREIEANPRRYDAVHHVTWGSLHLGSMLWKLPVPFVYGPIGGGQTAPADYWRYFGRDWPAERLRTAATGSLLKLNRNSRETVRNAAVTLVTNSATAAACKRLGAGDVRYMLAEGLPRDWLTDARPRPAGTPVVLWVGRLLPRKAPMLALQAFAELRRTMPVRLVMAGDGPLRGQVGAAIERLGLAKDVDLLGHVPWEDLKGLYDSASAFFFTSLRDSSGAQFLEALGRGLPAVAVSLSGIADADVGSAAVKVTLSPRPRDLPARLAVALHKILCDDGWESRSAAAVKWAADWVWPTKVVTATEIYREIAANPR